MMYSEYEYTYYKHLFLTPCYKVKTSNRIGKSNGGAAIGGCGVSSTISSRG